MSAAPHPLDRFGLVQIVDEVIRRVSGPGLLREALATADPARITPADREAMLDLIQQSERLEFEAMMARRAARGMSEAGDTVTR